MKFLDVILPLSIPKPLTYGIPLQLQGKILPGMRVEVGLGKNKLYSAIAYNIHNNPTEVFQVRPIKSIIDVNPLVDSKQLQFWTWLANYYSCSLGDVMQAALPSFLKLSNEIVLLWHSKYDDVPENLSDDAFLVAEALLIQKKLTLDDVKMILKDNNPSQVMDELFMNDLIIISDVLEQKYKPKYVKYVKLTSAYESDDMLNQLFNDLHRAPKQLAILFKFIELKRKKELIAASTLIKLSQASAAQLNTLVEKGVFEYFEKTISRLRQSKLDQPLDLKLSEVQQQTLNQIRELWQKKDVVLLHGVTGSGKTAIYIQLIREALAKQKQALLLMPEIALTAHIVNRLSLYFGDELGVYHSKFNDNERVEIWQKVKDGTYKIIIGARSAMWLPFRDLSVIIIDEEHEASYKQNDPAPRFQARDSAIYLASLHDAKVLLGSATPSLESYHNAETGKYGLVKLENRYGDAVLPEVQIISAKLYVPALSKIMTEPLLKEIANTLNKKKQVILFQNKRGYTPFSICANCGWVPQCKHCDVSLTYHKYSDKLHCHYCGNTYANINICEKCGHANMLARSFGTERVEEELQRIFPNANIARLDLDTVRGKNAHHKIISDFENGLVQILVGTQMVVKGLDFENVDLVGVLNADSLWSFPDFRINERAFQLLAQVSGRSGRTNDNGKVMIQAYKTNHTILNNVVNHNYLNFYKQEIYYRKEQQYPPFVRIIKVSAKHKNVNIAERAIQLLAQYLYNYPNIIVQGPSPALISKVKGKYAFELWIKHSKNNHKSEALKNWLQLKIKNVLDKHGNSTVQFIIDVDTMR